MYRTDPWIQKNIELIQDKKSSNDPKDLMIIAATLVGFIHWTESQKRDPVCILAIGQNIDVVKSFLNEECDKLENIIWNTDKFPAVVIPGKEKIQKTFQSLNVLSHLVPEPYGGVPEGNLTPPQENNREDSTSTLTLSWNHKTHFIVVIYIHDIKKFVLRKIPKNIIQMFGSHKLKNTMLNSLIKPNIQNTYVTEDVINQLIHKYD
jgi:hypothetical protein